VPAELSIPALPAQLNSNPWSLISVLIFNQHLQRVVNNMQRYFILFVALCLIKFLLSHYPSSFVDTT